MKLLSILFISALFFIGCSDDKPAQDIDAKLAVGNSLKELKLPNQHEKIESIPEDAKLVFFSFSKDVGHMCNDFLEKKDPSYLTTHHAVYIADISAAPSLIKSMFILKDLQKLPFPILLIDDDTLSAEFQKGQNVKSIVAVILQNGTITEIKNLKNTQELQELIERN